MPTAPGDVFPRTEAKEFALGLLSGDRPVAFLLALTTTKFSNKYQFKRIASRVLRGIGWAIAVEQLGRLVVEAASAGVRKKVPLL